MAAGNFNPSSQKGSTKFWGKKRNRQAGGGVVGSNYQQAVNVWVDVRAFIASFDGNTYDITDDIINGSLQRNTDKPTSMTITFANEGDKYRQKFIPNDRIVLFLRRNENEWQSFTGYIHNTPVYNLYTSRELTLNCSCIIRRLNQKYWDRHLRENIFVLSGPMPSKQSTTGPSGQPTAPGQSDAIANAEEDTNNVQVNNETIEQDGTGGGSSGGGTQAPNIQGSAAQGEITTPDQTLAFLLTAPDHIGLKPEMVLIEEFPSEWKERAAQITAENESCQRTWEDLIVCPDDDDCTEEGEGEGESPEEGGCEEGMTMGSVAQEAGFEGGELDRAIQTMCCESRGRAGVVNDSPDGVAAGTPIGLFQIILTTCQSVDPDCTQEKLKDPVYNAKIAKGVRDNKGDWSDWACKPGSENYGDCSSDTPISGCEEAEEEDAVANLEPSRIVNAVANAGGCDTSAWDYTASGPETHNHSPLIQSIIDDVTSKWDTYENTYPGHPGGEENSVDFWGPNRRGDDISDYGNMGREIHDYLLANYGDVTNWIIYEGTMTDAGGSGPDTSGWGHYDHVHITAGSDDCGGGTVGGGPGSGDGTGTGTDSGIPCGSGRSGQQPTESTEGGTTTTGGNGGSGGSGGGQPQTGGGSRSTPDQRIESDITINAVANTIMSNVAAAYLKLPPPAEGDESQLLEADASSMSFRRRTNFVLDGMLIEGKKMLRTPFRWGGGHGYDLELGNLRTRGVDASGLFNYLRMSQGLEPYDIGSAADYLNFLIDVRPFDPRRNYPIGTVLINPGNLLTMGHMGMVADETGKVLEANATGKVVMRYNIRESNYGWEGYTHVGIMPDVSQEEFTLFATARRREREKEQFNKFKREMREIEQDPSINNDDFIGYCDIDVPEGEFRALEAIGWDNVGPDNKMYYENESKYIKHFQRAVDQFNSLGGVEILPAERGGRVDLRVIDGRRGGNIFATTSSDGWMEFDTNNMDQGTENLKDAVATHELGHSLGLAHTPAGTPSVMQAAFITNSNNNISSPTEYDIQEYNALWGGFSRVRDDGEGIANVEAEDEPCITRHPLGVYKLATNAAVEASGATSIEAELKRRMALNGGDIVAAKEWLNSGEDPDLEVDAYQDFPEIWVNTDETNREWRHLAELNKEPYMPTIQEIADSGMYTMMSIGTGEIVFWYPWFVGEMADSVGGGSGGSGEANAEAEPTEDEVEEMMNNINNGTTTASQQVNGKRELGGSSMSSTNARVLNQKMVVEDIDLVDFSLYVSDDALVTHMFIMGSYRFQGGTHGGVTDLPCWRWSTVFDNPLIVAQAKETAHFDPNAFIQRYGVRSRSEHVEAIKIPGMAQIWAEQKWLRHWFDCYIIQLHTTFMPELYPGNHLEIKSLGIEVVVLQATHTFGSEWTTKITVSMPLRVTDETKIPPLPFWTLFTAEMVRENINPYGTPEGLYDPGAPLGTGGDLWDNINDKIDADNERLREYLDDWVELREAGAHDLVEDFVEGILAGQTGEDADNQPLSPAALQLAFIRYPQLRNVPGIENMTKKQIEDTYNVDLSW
jgi:hypothetical protein